MMINDKWSNIHWLIYSAATILLLSWVDMRNAIIIKCDLNLPVIDILFTYNLHEKWTFTLYLEQIKSRVKKNWSERSINLNLSNSYCVQGELNIKMLII